MISPETLRGYVLEELLAALLRASGYRLLVDESQDPNALCKGSNGLRIRGRGADHQVDVLGQLRLRLPFLYPLRLFVEAKCRGSKADLADVRNALGVLNDVNEHYSSAAAARSVPAYDRYTYRYALFSTSGFTSDAERFAITQQISLIDLRPPSFSWLREAAERIAKALLDLAVREELDSFPVNQAREALRRALGTWPTETYIETGTFSEASNRARQTTTVADKRLPTDELAAIAASASELDGRLYLGLTGSPFIVVLQPDEPELADELLSGEQGPVIADLDFAGTDVADGEWTLTAKLPGARDVTFRSAVAPTLEEAVFGSGDTPPRDILQRPHRVMSVVVGESDRELVFEPVPRSEFAEEQPFVVRSRRLKVDLAYKRGGAPHVAGWTPTAALEIVRRLRAEGWPHAAIIEYASSNGGVIDRDTVYSIAGYSDDRMLRGFTRPPRRITRDLIREGVLPPGVRWPLVTEYSGGVLATHFTVPDEFVGVFQRGSNPT